MAGTWEGFSEADIGFYQKKSEESSERQLAKKRAGHLAGRKSSEKGAEGGRGGPDAPETAPLIEGEHEEKERAATGAKGGVAGSSPVCLKVMQGKGYELVDRNSAEASRATLQLFEARQKVLEEQNKRRKEMLAKVISASLEREARQMATSGGLVGRSVDGNECSLSRAYLVGRSLRKKQTSEEAKRLQHIQEELQKLDLLLSNDVGILRNKIEEASLDFVEAQKRYNKAEKEFLEAKQNLLVKLEKKELLTKLLCTIIEQNELRKAQKLSELMEKLNINETPNSVILSPDSQSALHNSKPEPHKDERPS